MNKAQARHLLFVLDEALSELESFISGSGDYIGPKPTVNQARYLTLKVWTPTREVTRELRTILGPPDK